MNFPAGNGASRPFSALATKIRTVRSAVSALAVVLALVLLAPCGAQAQNSDFAAGYQTSAVTQNSDGTVQMTFAVRLSNNSSSDVTGANISVTNPAAPQTFGTIQNVSVSAGANGLASGTITVPQDVYQSWQQGGRPLLSLDYTDADGNPVHQVFQATPVSAGATL